MQWLDRLREKILLRWIATNNIRKEMYKFFYGKYTNQYLDILTDIDMRLKSFIEQGGVLVYAYDKEVYQKVKQLKKQCINYLFVEHEWMTKLNYLRTLKIKRLIFIKENSSRISIFPHI